MSDFPVDLGVDLRKFTAAVDMIGRTGSDAFQLRFDESEEPIVWIASAHWGDRADLWTAHWEACGGLTPWQALFRLCEATMDGGTCRHCQRPTAVDDKPPDDALAAAGTFICFYRYDPELHMFRRSCEGQAA